MNNETMIQTKCIAVIGGTDYEGESFDSLRLFDCQSTADLYKAKLQQDFDYVLTRVLPVSQYSAMMGGTIEALAHIAA
jgi:peroxiredoxin family protein